MIELRRHLDEIQVAYKAQKIELATQFAPTAASFVAQEFKWHVEKSIVQIRVEIFFLPQPEQEKIYAKKIKKMCEDVQNAYEGSLKERSHVYVSATGSQVGQLIPVGEVDVKQLGQNFMRDEIEPVISSFEKLQVLQEKSKPELESLEAQLQAAACKCHEEKTAAEMEHNNKLEKSKLDAQDKVKAILPEDARLAEMVKSGFQIQQLVRWIPSDVTKNRYYFREWCLAGHYLPAVYAIVGNADFFWAESAANSMRAVISPKSFQMGDPLLNKMRQILDYHQFFCAAVPSESLQEVLENSQSALQIVVKTTSHHLTPEEKSCELIMSKALYMFAVWAKLHRPVVDDELKKISEFLWQLMNVKNFHQQALAVLAGWMQQYPAFAEREMNACKQSLEKDYSRESAQEIFFHVQLMLRYSLPAERRGEFLPLLQKHLNDQDSPTNSPSIVALYAARVLVGCGGESVNETIINILFDFLKDPDDNVWLMAQCGLREASQYHCGLREASQYDSTIIARCQQMVCEESASIFQRCHVSGLLVQLHQEPPQKEKLLQKLFPSLKDSDVKVRRQALLALKQLNAMNRACVTHVIGCVMNLTSDAKEKEIAEDILIHHRSTQWDENIKQEMLKCLDCMTIEGQQAAVRILSERHVITPAVFMALETKLDSCNASMRFFAAQALIQLEHHECADKIVTILTSLYSAQETQCYRMRILELLLNMQQFEKFRHLISDNGLPSCHYESPLWFFEVLNPPDYFNRVFQIHRTCAQDCWCAMFQKNGTGIASASLAGGAAVLTVAAAAVERGVSVAPRPSGNMGTTMGCGVGGGP
ncbi:MAG: hypothetical protein A2X77_03215 [Gammaproteobacteria bacterium GWE2_42_36]|nr:MAG: hypothetical protein A2X77_03215 [Gammaproteobacteria bacterium GWE2_42_36]